MCISDSFKFRLKRCPTSSCDSKKKFNRAEVEVYICIDISSKSEREREERIIRFEFHKIEEHILSSIV